MQKKYIGHHFRKKIIPSLFKENSRNQNTFLRKQPKISRKNDIEPNKAVMTKHHAGNFPCTCTVLAITHNVRHH